MDSHGSFQQKHALVYHRPQALGDVRPMEQYEPPSPCHNAYP